MAGTRTACTSRSTGCGCSAAARRTRSCAVGAEDAKPGPGVLEAIAAADLVLLPPSNPVVSIGTMLAVPGIRDALAAARAGGRACRRSSAAHPVRGMADKVLAAIGVETTAAAVALHYGPATRLLDGWLVDTRRRRRGGGGTRRPGSPAGRPAADGRTLPRPPRWPAPRWRWRRAGSVTERKRVAARLVRRSRAARGRSRRRPRAVPAQRLPSSDFAWPTATSSW